MCKTISTSLVTLAVVLTASFLTFKRNRFAAIVIILIGIMQFIDAILWVSIYYNLKSLNELVSTYILPIVFAVQIVGVYYFSGYRNKWFEIGIVCLLLTAPKWFILCNATSRDPNGYLQWCNFDIELPARCLYLFFLTFPILQTTMDPFDKLVILVSMWSMFLVNFSHGSFGSRWCWSSNIMAFFLLFRSC